MNFRLRTLVVISALAPLVAGCSSGGGSGIATTTADQVSIAPTTQPPTSATSPTTSSTTLPSPITNSPTTPSTEATTSTSTEPLTAPATDSTTVASIAPDDWKAILEELARRRVALYAAPDLSRIGEYCAVPTSDCAQGLQTQLGDEIAKGQHIEGQQPFTVVDVIQASVSEDTPKVATILFIIGPTTPPAARVVDAAGNVVDSLSLTTTNTKGRFLLVEHPEDSTLPWRLVHIDDLGPVP